MPGRRLLVSLGDFQERFFLFVSASTQIKLGGQTVPAGSLPATDPGFIAELLEGLSLDFGAKPGFQLLVPDLLHPLAG